MTVREKLREIAAWVTLPAPPEERAAAEYAAALRALADRIDAEMAVACFVEHGTTPFHEARARAVLAVIASLDAPLPPGAPQNTRKP